MTKPKPILQVEDQETDILFMQIVMKKAAVTVPLHSVLDGREAMDYLSGAGKYVDRDSYPLPCLVLLDLKLPQIPGLQVLRWIRDQPHFKELLVIVLTSSEAETDIAEAYRLGANSYITKPINLSEQLEIVQLIKKYWLQGLSPPPAICPFIKPPPLVESDL